MALLSIIKPLSDIVKLEPDEDISQSFQEASHSSVYEYHIDSKCNKQTHGKNEDTSSSVAIIDDIESKKYGHLPSVIKGHVVGEDISGFKKENIDSQRMMDILQNIIKIQPEDYCKTVDIKIALERDENGESTHLTHKELLLSVSLLKFYNNFRNLYIFTKLVNGESAISLRLIEYFVVNYVVDNNTVYNMLHYQANPSYLIKRLDKQISRKSTSSNTKSTITTTPTNPANSSSSTDTMVNANAKTKKGLHITASKEEISKNINKNKKSAEKRKLMGDELDIMVDFDNYILVHDRYKAQLKEHSKLSFDPFCRSTRVCRGTNTSRSTRICLVLPGGVTLSTTIAQMNFFRWAIHDHVLEYILDNQSTIDEAMTDYETRKAISSSVTLEDSLEPNSNDNHENNSINCHSDTDADDTNAIIHGNTDSGLISDTVNGSSASDTNNHNIQNVDGSGNDNGGGNDNDNGNTYARLKGGSAITGAVGGSIRTKKASNSQQGRRRRRGRDNNRTVTRYTCRRTITFD